DTEQSSGSKADQRSSANERGEEIAPAHGDMRHRYRHHAYHGNGDGSHRSGTCPLAKEDEPEDGRLRRLRARISRPHGKVSEGEQIDEKELSPDLSKSAKEYPADEGGIWLREGKFRQKMQRQQ